ncbi:MAG: MATE family efflux transporter [Planctomycetes bacterium]|nr:MATE family efflux transporter [Planctomycetota bacterium]
MAIQRLTTARGLLALALPMAAGVGVGFFLHFMNRLFLAWYSPDALAASYPAGMLTWTLQGFFVASASYLGSFAAQHHGAGEDDEAGAMCWPGLWCGLIATAISLAIIPLRGPIVALFGLRDPAVAAQMAELTGWYLAETGPIALMAAMSGFFAGLGRTRLVFALSAGGCLVSIALNRWLIFGGFGIPALGVTGAGIATLVTSLLSLAVWSALFFAPRMRAVFGTWRNRNADGARIRRFCRYALPRGGSEVLEMVAFLVFSAAITRLPTASVSASNIAFSIYLLVLVPVMGLSQGVAIAVGQCLGAGRPDLARSVGWLAVRLATPVLCAVAVIFLVFPEQLAALYADTDADAAGAAARWEEIRSQVAPVLACLAIAAIGDGLHWIFRMVVVGAGDTRWTLVAMVASAILILALPVWALLRLADPALLASWNVTALTASYAMFALYCWVIAAIMFLRFLFGPWRGMSVRR